MDLHSLEMVHDNPEDGRWEAFVRRDPGADGRFVVAVETTCIYCRPTCPARRPLRKNVRFLADAATAERQGYRACKRCRPELAQRPAEAMVETVKSMLLRALDAPPGLDALARATGISPAHLQKTFRKHTGLSPKEFVAAARLERWKAELRAGRPVTEAWLEAGYGSAGRAYAAARQQMGMSPAQYGKGGAGLRILWTVLDTPLGALLLARTERGMCRVAFGESAGALEALLRSEFPAAELERATPGSDARLRAAAAALGERSGAERLPLDVQATTFQRQVWQALAGHPQREHRELRRGGALGRPSDGGPGGGPGLRDEPGRARSPLSPRRALRREPLRLPLGPGAEAGAPRRREERRHGGSRRRLTQAFGSGATTGSTESAPRIDARGRVTSGEAGCMPRSTSGSCPPRCSWRSDEPRSDASVVRRDHPVHRTRLALDAVALAAFVRDPQAPVVDGEALDEHVLHVGLEPRLVADLVHGDDPQPLPGARIHGFHRAPVPVRVPGVTRAVRDALVHERLHLGWGHALGQRRGSKEHHAGNDEHR